MKNYDEIKQAFKEGLDADDAIKGRYVIIDPLLMQPGIDVLAARGKPDAMDMHIVLEFVKGNQKLAIHHKFNIYILANEYNDQMQVPVEGFIKQVHGYIEEAGVDPEKTSRGWLEAKYSNKKQRP